MRRLRAERTLALPHLLNSSYILWLNCSRRKRDQKRKSVFISWLSPAPFSARSATQRADHLSYRICRR